jgi:hypothetical protein
MTIGDRTGTRPEPASAPLRTGGSEPRDALLQASRRLDWRFLLPAPTLNHVIYLGPRAGALLDSLHRFSCRLVVAGDSPLLASAAPFDLAVVSAPSLDTLQMAERLLRPGGHVYIETHGALSRRRGLHVAAVRRVLRRLAFSAVRVAAHWPDFERCTRIVALDRVALRHAVDSTVRLEAGRIVVASLVRPSAIELLAPALSVTARSAGRAIRP